MQRCAVDELHGQKRCAAGAGWFAPGVVDSCDSGVLKPSEKRCFVTEAAGRTFGEHGGTNDLEGDGALRRFLRGGIHHAHAAFADEVLNGVFAKGGAGGKASVRIGKQGIETARGLQRGIRII